MSAVSQKERMREALLITEGNLSSLMAAKHSDAVLMGQWRNVVRRALSHFPPPVVASLEG